MIDMKGKKRKRIRTLLLFEVSLIAPAVDIDLQAFYNLQKTLYCFLQVKQIHSTMTLQEVDIRMKIHIQMREIGQVYIRE